VLIALAVAFSSTEAMRDSFKHAAKRAKKSGGGLSDLALHLARAAVLPALVAMHAKLPDNAQAELRRQRRAQDHLHAAEAMH
jgi:C4-dicarboxylate-specific signal transduction histidine kinase